MTDHEISAVKIGLFISGTVREKRPRTAEERRTRLIVWACTVLLISWSSVALGVVLFLGTLLFLAMHTPTPTERTAP
jgi:hypothetical protein